MQTYSIFAGQTSQPIPVPGGALVSVTSGSASLEYTLGSLADIGNGVATWGGGVLPAVAERSCFVRFSATGGSATLSVDQNPSQTAVQSVGGNSIAPLRDVGFSAELAALGVHYGIMSRTQPHVLGFCSNSPTFVEDASAAIGSYSTSTDWGAFSVTASNAVTRLGSKSILMSLSSTVGTFGYIQRDYGAATMTIAATDTITFYIYVPTAQINSVTFFVTDAAAVFTNNFNFTLNATWFKQGWNAITVKASEFTQSGTISWGALRAWRLRFNCTNAQAGQIYFGGFAVGLKARPKVLLGFDDGWALAYTNAFPIMRKYGLVGYQSIIGNLVNTPSYMTDAQYQSMYDAGWDITVHGPLTGNNLYDLGSQSAMQADIQANRDYAKSHGWLRGNDIYVYPQGVWSSGVTDLTALNAVAASGFRAARTFSNGTTYQVNRGEMTAGGIGNPLIAPARNIGTNAVATLIADLDDAISRGCTYHIAGHKVLSTNNPVSVGGAPPADGNEYYLDDFELLCGEIAARIRRGLVDNMAFSAWCDAVIPR